MYVLGIQGDSTQLNFVIRNNSVNNHFYVAQDLHFWVFIMVDEIK